MKRIKIGDKKYTIEFSIEATLYNECTEKILDLIATAGITQNKLEDENVEAEEKAESAVNVFVKSTADIPQKALALFYGGLIEHHGTESGDKSVKSKQDAKILMLQYMKENGKTLFDIMNEMLEEVQKDNFFDLIGVEKVAERAQESVKEIQKQMKVPQDHKKKSKGGNT